MRDEGKKEGENGICSFCQTGCGIVLKLSAGLGMMKNGKSYVKGVTLRSATLTKRDRDKYCDWSGIVGLNQK